MCFGVPQARLSWECLVLGLQEGEEEHEWAPGSPHLVCTVHFCLSGAGSIQAQLTSVVYEIKGPERGGKGTQAQKVKLPGTWR
jgi:hypothetical protein